MDGTSSVEETLGVVRAIGVVSTDEVEAISVLVLLKSPRVELELETTGVVSATGVVSGTLTELELVSAA